MDKLYQEPKESPATLPVNREDLINKVQLLLNISTDPLDLTNITSLDNLKSLFDSTTHHYVKITDLQVDLGEIGTKLIENMKLIQAKHKSLDKKN
ncbi:MAG: hypothetical protein Hyperionvirus2_178 [Hyperionvirus sp.]|uniref:Uncharacterized protein n=1 Tax=Hyperionvirus sp. TaxID=2487770 RepID=A0A3G5A6C4_9VIRU|nr:MAG: hypothetical protein Hyperionvirus2_178 [Hyperionvirus sp.]